MCKAMVLTLAAALLAASSACVPEAPPRTDLTGSDRISLPQDQYAEVNGVSLHYLDWGGDGKLLLLVPGLWHTAHTYDAIAPSFVERYRVVAVTRREHGPSAKSTGPITLDVLVDDLADFIALFTDEPAIVVGQSFAGLEMPRLASQHPDRVMALIFLDAVYDWPGWAADDQPPFPGAYEFDDDYRSFADLDGWFEGTYPEIWGEPARAHLRSQTYLTEDGRVAWQFPWNAPLAGEFMEIDRGWTPEEYEGIQVPILSIQAEFEGFFEENLAAKEAPLAVLDTARIWARDLDAVLKRRGGEMLAAAVSDAVMVEFAATHHWLHLQRPERVVRTMMDFLEAHQIR